jgi:hypothetical protein
LDGIDTKDVGAKKAAGAAGGGVSNQTKLIVASVLLVAALGLIGWQLFSPPPKIVAPATEVKAVEQLAQDVRKPQTRPAQPGQPAPPPPIPMGNSGSISR